VGLTHGLDQKSEPGHIINLDLTQKAIVACKISYDDKDEKLIDEHDSKLPF
jgi:hypothetical protein